MAESLSRAALFTRPFRLSLAAAKALTIVSNRLNVQPKQHLSDYGRPARGPAGLASMSG
jgi:hypothetical protein